MDEELKTKNVWLKGHTGKQTWGGTSTLGLISVTRLWQFDDVVEPTCISPPDSLSRGEMEMDQAHG